MYRWKISKKQEDKGWMEICKKPTKNWNSYASILITNENEEPDIIEIAKYYGGLSVCKALLRELEDCDL